MRTRLIVTTLLLAAAALVVVTRPPGVRVVEHAAAHRARDTSRPNVVVITVDALRADRLSYFGYGRATSPSIDALLRRSVVFTAARTPEPLTAPALCSMVTSLPPHEHGATRNGLPMKGGEPSWFRVLSGAGYATAAFVGNWTLSAENSGLAPHFDHYEEVATHKRWFGVLREEALGSELTAAARTWVERRDVARPWAIWVHYVEPHAPYRCDAATAGRLGIDAGTASGRYDCEVAAVDAEIGRLLDIVRSHGPAIVVFAADHGESLGEHGEQGHGRVLYETTLRIPAAVAWEGVLPGGRSGAPFLLGDTGPTLLGLLGLPAARGMRGTDWSGELRRPGTAHGERPIVVEAHKGAVLSQVYSERARERGLLELALIRGATKEVWSPSGTRLYDLSTDPGETRPREVATSPELARALQDVRAALAAGAHPGGIDPERAARLRSLGYVD